MKNILSIFKLQLRPMPKSVWRNIFPPEVEYTDTFSDVVELTPYQTKKVNQAKAWWGRVRNNISRELDK